MVYNITMIKFEIIDSENKDLTGEYTFYKNLIYLGKNHQCEVYLPEANIIDNHIFIEVVESKLIVQLHPDVEYILVNNKRTIKYKHLRIGDLIQIGSTKLKILEFLFEEKPILKQVLAQKIQSLKDDNPQLKDVVKLIRNEL